MQRWMTVAANSNMLRQQRSVEISSVAVFCRRSDGEPSLPRSISVRRDAAHRCFDGEQPREATQSLLCWGATLSRGAQGSHTLLNTASSLKMVLQTFLLGIQLKYDSHSGQCRRSTLTKRLLGGVFLNYICC